MRSLTTAAVLAHPDGWHGHMSWDGGWWMLLWGTLVMSALVTLILWLVRTTQGGVTAREDSIPSAQRILAERYARGELSTEEYRERLAELPSP